MPKKIHVSALTYLHADEFYNLIKIRLIQEQQCILYFFRSVCEAFLSKRKWHILNRILHSTLKKILVFLIKFMRKIKFIVCFSDCRNFPKWLEPKKRLRNSSSSWKRLRRRIRMNPNQNQNSSVQYAGLNSKATRLAT